MTDFDRHYRVPSVARWYLRCFVVFGAFVVSLAVLATPKASSPVLVLILLYVGLGLVPVWGERSWPRMGLFESDDGIRAAQMLGSVNFRWDSIARFEHSRRMPRSRVLAVGHDGRVIPIIGTAQGCRIVWQDGETEDIVGVLNDRLETWRSEPRHDPPAAN